VKAHTAGELADRLSELGYVVRVRDDLHHRRVRLLVTDEGNELLRSPTAVHLEELRRLRPLPGGLPDR
jgi:DNA-binding MarR family transcriptional regulator